MNTAAGRTHKQNLAHLRSELERLGVRVVNVRLVKSSRVYSASACNFVAGGHIFDWRPGSANVVVRKEVGGKYVAVGSLPIVG